MKIVSLVPSLTQLLFDLGLEDQIAGRTRFCVHPAGTVRRVPVVGGTKNPRIDTLRRLAPDLVIANKEENRREDVEALSAFTRVLVTDISSVHEALEAMVQIGRETNREDQAGELVARIHALVPSAPPQHVKTAYLIWKNPWMSVGGDTYIHDVMQLWGFVNVFGELKRYPHITDAGLIGAGPKLVLLSSEPYPFKDVHSREITALLPDAQVQCVNGEWFSWYGSGMLQGFRELNRLTGIR